MTEGLPADAWGKLTLYQEWALEILNTSGGAEIEPQCPLSMRTAMHDMWRFGFAERRFAPLRYLVTPLGQKAYAHNARPPENEAATMRTDDENDV